jgi:AraC-like DNA-binding protein
MLPGDLFLRPVSNPRSRQPAALNGAGGAALPGSRNANSAVPATSTRQWPPPVATALIAGSGFATIGFPYGLLLPRKGPAGRHRSPNLNHLNFDRAARFLRHIVEHVQTASVSELRKADLSSAGRALIALEREQARLHETLKRYLPASPVAARRCPESHAEQVVHAVLQRIELDYAHPFTLQRLARDLGMNGAYLSTLFSRTVGIPFKTYLTELRLQKAKDLLADITKTAADVAFATGYSSQERFRSAFKKATGLSPKAWRETMQPSPSAPSG